MANPVSRTAYYTLGVRAWDATLPKPICGDTYAKHFVTAEAQKIWEEFKDEHRPNTGNAARHAIIDELVQKALVDQPEALVVIVGAGFDTRAYRLTGGKWVEADEPPLIAAKETALAAASARNPLTRVPIDFSREALVDKLQSYRTNDTVHVIVEGVLMYLIHDARQQLVNQLKKLFPNHVLYCDLMRQSFFEKYSRPIHERIVALGTSFTDIVQNPEQLFLKNNYKTISHTSIPLYAARRASLGIPPFMIQYFLKTLREGYQVWQFDHRA
jgi:methyltransferase (TIGR00027 family)